LKKKVVKPHLQGAFLSAKVTLSGDILPLQKEYTGVLERCFLRRKDADIMQMSSQ
jgi:hypothetical protein